MDSITRRTAARRDHGLNSTALTRAHGRATESIGKVAHGKTARWNGSLGRPVRCGSGTLGNICERVKVTSGLSFQTLIRKKIRAKKHVTAGSLFPFHSRSSRRLRPRVWLRFMFTVGHHSPRQRRLTARVSIVRPRSVWASPHPHGLTSRQQSHVL